MEGGNSDFVQVLYFNLLSESAVHPTALSNFYGFWPGRFFWLSFLLVIFVGRQAILYRRVGAALLAYYLSKLYVTFNITFQHNHFRVIPFG